MVNCKGQWRTAGLQQSTHERLPGQSCCPLKMLQQAPLLEPSAANTKRHDRAALKVIEGLVMAATPHASGRPI